MQVRFFGVRGSTPASGPEFDRYGGHTSCVAVYADGEDVPAVVFDAGTGLRRLSSSLDGRAFRGAILLSHLHWDHVQGLPFFDAAANADSRTEVFVPGEAGDNAAEMLRPMVGPPFFPLAPDELRGDWSFALAPTDPFTVGVFTITPLPVAHIGLTLGYRVSDGHSTVAYITDRCGDDTTPLRANALALANDVDLLIHDAQHTADEYTDKAFLGHATAEHALALASAAGSRRLALFHHDFVRTDDEIDAIVAGVAEGQPMSVFGAAEGMTVDLRSQ